MTYTLTVDVRKPPMTLNEQRRAHWQTVRRAKTEAEQLVWAAAKAARIPRMGRAHVEIVWHTPDKRRRDADSLAPFLKATLDTLVRCEIIDDDSYQYVPRVTLGVEPDPQNPRIQITITELT